MISVSFCGCIQAEVITRAQILAHDFAVPVEIMSWGLCVMNAQENMVTTAGHGCFLDSILQMILAFCRRVQTCGLFVLLLRLP